MSRKKIIWLIIILILAVAGVMDAVRYLKSGKENKTKVEVYQSFPAPSAKEIILAYNAYGGIYPGIEDFFHKIIAPSTYPCNLCYISFGTFGMKDEWKHFLDSLNYKVIQLHKDEFRRNYLPADLPLPAILLSDGTYTELLVSAAEINKCKSLWQLENLVRSKF